MTLNELIEILLKLKKNHEEYLVCIVTPNHMFSIEQIKVDRGDIVIEAE